MLVLLGLLRMNFLKSRISLNYVSDFHTKKNHTVGNNSYILKFYATTVITGIQAGCYTVR
jgi:hypothetical protein